MSTSILNVTIILIIVVPMLYFMFGGSKNKNKIASFRKKVNALNIYPEKVGVWHSGAIGLDKKQGKLCYQSELLDDSIHQIDLKSIVGCEVKKTYHTENVHQQDINMLKTVSLQLKTNQKSEIMIPVYDAKLYTHPGNDLMESFEWAKLISTFIKDN